MLRHKKLAALKREKVKTSPSAKSTDYDNFISDIVKRVNSKAFKKKQQKIFVKEYNETIGCFGDHNARDSSFEGDTKSVSVLHLVRKK